MNKRNFIISLIIVSLLVQLGLKILCQIWDVKNGLDLNKTPQYYRILSVNQLYKLKSLTITSKFLEVLFVLQKCKRKTKKKTPLIVNYDDLTNNVVQHKIKFHR